MPERIDFWGIPEPWGPILVYSLVTLSFLFMLYRVYLQARLWWKVGRAERRFDRIPRRLWNMIRDSILMLKVLVQPFPGWMHSAMAWAYFIFFLGTALATINGHF